MNKNKNKIVNVTTWTEMFIFYYIFEIYNTLMFERFGQFAEHNEHFDVHVWQRVERLTQSITGSYQHIWAHIFKLTSKKCEHCCEKMNCRLENSTLCLENHDYYFTIEPKQLIKTVISLRRLSSTGFQTQTSWRRPVFAGFSQILLWRSLQDLSNQHFRSLTSPFSPILAQSSPSGLIPFQLSGSPLNQKDKLRDEEQKELVQ